MSEPLSVVVGWADEFHISLLRKTTDRKTVYEAWSGKRLLSTATNPKECMNEALAHLGRLSEEEREELRGPVAYVKKVGGREL